MKKNQKAIKYFKEHDKILFSVAEKIESIKELQSDEPNNYFFRLCRSIIGQQLASKASNAICSRFQKLFSGKVTPRKVLNISSKEIRSVGLSEAKVEYIKNLAKKIVDKDLRFDGFKNLDNQQIIDELTKVKGIGPWTAEMFLMFTLAREDVFSHGDLGLRKAIKKIYGLKKEPTQKQTERISRKWIPYRTYACLVLWKSLD